MNAYETMKAMVDMVKVEAERTFQASLTAAQECGRTASVAAHARGEHHYYPRESDEAILAAETALAAATARKEERLDAATALRELVEALDAKATEYLMAWAKGVTR